MRLGGLTGARAPVAGQARYPRLHPEAVLARELALCDAPLALVTDAEVGTVEGEGVTHTETPRVFGANVTRLLELVEKIIEGLPRGVTAPCPDAPDGIKLPFGATRPTFCRLLKGTPHGVLRCPTPATITGTIREPAVPGGIA